MIHLFNNQLKDGIFGESKSKLGTLEMATKFNSLRGNIGLSSIEKWMVWLESV